ncbi:MAG: methionyl-tRNA formyltransferase [Pseudomonadota bacterium]
MKLVFMGTPDFSVPVLEALLEAGHEVCRVYSQPPRRSGRGKQVRPSPVHARAEALGLQVLTPERFKGSVVDEFATLQADAAIVIAYGQILPQKALDAPEKGCLNLHASLLPRWRGAAPIQRAIMAGDAETGVCVMQMEAGLDTGPVLARQVTPILPDDTALLLHDRLAEISAKLIVDTLLKLDSLPAAPQDETGVTYAAKIDKSEARIDWTRPAVDLSAHIRGLSPSPGAWCEIDGGRVKVLLAETEAGSGAPGTVLDDRLLIACGEGALRLKQVQPAGKAAMATSAYLSGRSVLSGSVVS